MTEQNPNTSQVTSEQAARLLKYLHDAGVTLFTSGFNKMHLAGLTDFCECVTLANGATISVAFHVGAAEESPAEAAEELPSEKDWSPADARRD